MTERLNPALFPGRDPERCRREGIREADVGAKNPEAGAGLPLLGDNWRQDLSELRAQWEEKQWGDEATSCTAMWTMVETVVLFSMKWEHQKYLGHVSDINLHVNRITLVSWSGGAGGEMFVEGPGMGIERPVRRLCTNQCERFYIKITKI